MELDRAASALNDAAFKRNDAASKLILALDFPAAEPALAFVDNLAGQLRWVKVGLELYLSAGSGIVSSLRERGLHVFLDLKLHDIPNTVAQAVASISGSGAELVTVHALGGPAMLVAAQAAASERRLRLLAVTVLTSMDPNQLQAIGIDESPADTVSRLARLALTSGISGLVCSSQEVARLRRELGPGALLVVPGIRPAGSSANDQSRTATPREAILAGASMLVVGRPITQAGDPGQALQDVLAEIAGCRT